MMHNSKAMILLWWDRQD